jgi:asparagine synthase (glutamine-hydrolysing)
MALHPTTTMESADGIEHDFGFVPRFHYRGETISAGRLVEAIARSGGVSPDFDALNVFLRTDTFLDGETPFREVRRFSPAPTIIAPVEMTREQAMDGYVDLFRQAIARRATMRSVLPLSGGRDSRHILLELNAQGCLPSRAITVALETSTDGDVAREVARAVGIRHDIVRANYSIEGARHTVRATDLMSQEHAWFADVARARDGQAWWDGIAGDVLSAGHFLEDWNVRLFATGALDELAERLVRPGPVPYFRDRSLFPRDRAVSAVRNELGRHTTAANPVGSFYFWNRTRTNVGSSAFGMLSPAGQRTLAPFLDRDLWRFLASIPLRHVVGQTLHEEVIRRAYPAFTHLGYSDKRPPGSWFYRRRSMRMLGYLSTRRPRSENLAAAARLVRSLLIPSHVMDADWVVGSWVYGDTLRKLLR